MPRRLLAKSVPKGDDPQSPREEVTLTGHTNCVMAAADALFGTDGQPTRLGRSWLRFFGLGDEGYKRFRRHLRTSIAAHDWGKANDGFQDLVTRRGDQCIRHEHLSGLFLAEVLADESNRAWFREAGLDEVVVLSGASSHHVKTGEMAFREPWLVDSRPDVALNPDHEDFAAIWRAFQDEVGSGCPAPPKFPDRWSKGEVEGRGEALHDRLVGEKRRLRSDPARSRWIAAVRAGLIAADAVGSAAIRMTDESNADPKGRIADWVGKCFAETLTGDEVWDQVIFPRIEQLRASKRWQDGTGHTFQGVSGFTRFQCEVAALGPRALLMASCGSGKTLAAWNWIKAQIDERPAGRPISRVLFLYPTRATATEGFRDYVSWAPESVAGLLSGTAAYELRELLENPDESGGRMEGRNYRSDPRLYALGHWTKRIFSATADQFLPFMQYAYGPLCQVPLLAEAVIVVDEVHSYDKAMFNTLRRFLGEFPDVPVLCMTATLPAERVRDLVGCGLEPMREQEGPSDDGLTHAQYRRYGVEWIDRDGATHLARGALEGRKRILWVSNRVDDCQAAFKTIAGGIDRDLDDISAFCYHSRFKLEHRKKRHAELVAAFQDAAKDGATSRGVFGSTTQVCELSLDLDAEILVVELAPIAALIQRLGRCNRDSRKMRGRPVGRVYVIRREPGKEMPYAKEELDAAEAFVDKLVGGKISQEMLNDLYREFNPAAIEPDRLCPFLDSGPFADGKEESFREIDDFTVNCILHRDEDAVVAALGARQPIDGFIVPVPRHLAEEHDHARSRLPRWLRLAPTERYDSLIGFDGRRTQSARSPAP